MGETPVELSCWGLLSEPGRLDIAGETKEEVLLFSWAVLGRWVGAVGSWASSPAAKLDALPWGQLLPSASLQMPFTTCHLHIFIEEPGFLLPCGGHSHVILGSQDSWVDGWSEGLYRFLLSDCGGWMDRRRHGRGLVDRWKAGSLWTRLSLSIIS